jgi:type I restriction enzyme S subunit
MADSSFKTVTLGDLIDSDVIQVTTGFPFGGHNVDGEGVPHIRPFNVGTDGEIHLDQIKSIPAVAAAGKPTLQRNDIVFNNTNTKELVGKCAPWSSDDQHVFSNHMTRIRVVDNACDPAYLSFAILQHWMAGKSEMLARSHVAQASIIGSRFREIEIPWPEPTVQRSIGSLIRWLRIASRSETNQLVHARTMKEVVMTQLFTLGLAGEPQRESEIGSIPASWNVDRLGLHHSVVSGGTPSRSNPAFWSEGTVPWVKTTEVDYCVIKETEEHITEIGLEKSAAKLLRAGTLLMAMYGQGVTRGRVALLGIDAACNQACAAITPKDGVILPRYLYHFLSWRYKAIRSLAHGGQQQNLNLEIVRELPVAYPHTQEEQVEIIAILDALDRKIELHDEKRSVFEALFRLMLNKLMTGDVSTSDLDFSALSSASMQRAEATA